VIFRFSAKHAPAATFLIAATLIAAYTVSSAAALENWRSPTSTVEKQAARALGYFMRYPSYALYPAPSCDVLVISSSLVLTDGCARGGHLLKQEPHRLALGPFKDTAWRNAQSYYQFDIDPIDRGDHWAIFNVSGDLKKDYGTVRLATKRPEPGESIFVLKTDSGGGPGQQGRVRYGCYIAALETGPRILIYTCGDPNQYVSDVDYLFSLDGTLVGISTPSRPPWIDDPNPDRRLDRRPREYQAAIAVSEILKESAILLILPPKNVPQG
jgi:hypothetical protein